MRNQHGVISRNYTDCTLGSIRLSGFEDVDFGGCSRPPKMKSTIRLLCLWIPSRGMHENDAFDVPITQRPHVQQSVSQYVLLHLLRSVSLTRKNTLEKVRKL